jgi:cytidine deaminase
MAHNVRQLIDAAVAARQRAYAKYSDFLVGAALLTADGKIFGGCNVENVSYGLTNCAERTAVFSAIAAGQSQFELLAIASKGGVTPCGACRQVLAEFAPDLPILLVDVDRPDEYKRANLHDLLPGAFTFQRAAVARSESQKSPKPKKSRRSGK